MAVIATAVVEMRDQTLMRIKRSPAAAAAVAARMMKIWRSEGSALDKVSACLHPRVCVCMHECMCA
eukprot:1145568-Pelagomonas_calceolata.AAC.2